MSTTERLTRSSISFDVGSRVVTGIGAGKKGVVSFVGETQFAPGEWIGLTLDNPDGKNDGSLGGISYFQCKPLYGVFVKRAQIKLDKDAPTSAAVDPKDKLAALREKRRAREAGSAPSPVITSASVAAASLAKEAATPVVKEAAVSAAIEVAIPAPKEVAIPVAREAVISVVREAPASIVKEAAVPVVKEVAIPVAIEAVISVAAKVAVEDAPTSPLSPLCVRHDEFEEAQEEFIEDNPMKSTQSSRSHSFNTEDKTAVAEKVPEKVLDKVPEKVLEKDENPKEVDGEVWNKQVSDLMAVLNSAKVEKELQTKEMNTMKAAVGTLTTQLGISNVERDGLKQQLITAVELENTQKKNQENEQKKVTESILAKSRESNLEAQVNELMDTLEILTLDKEQLVMDNELLQAKLDEKNSKESASVSSGQAGLAEENTKLREALRRLHTQSTSDKAQLDLLNEKNEREERELTGLREYQVRADAELVELREAVDATSSYESMIETLTEKNLEYSQKSIQLETTVRDLEEQQELSEELDQQQRQEIDLFRRTLDSKAIEIAEKEAAIQSMDGKVSGLKMINEKFRRHGEQLRGEMDALRGQVSLSAAESDRMALRARAGAMSHLELGELKSMITTLSSELSQSHAAVNRWKASYVRMYSIFGRSSLFSLESELCAREVTVVAASALGSSISQSILQATQERLSNGVQLSVAPSQGVGEGGEDDIIDDVAEGNLKLKLKYPKSRDVDASAIRRVLVVLRATSVCWHCVGCVLAEQNTEDQHMNASLSSAVTSLHLLFEAVRSVLDTTHTDESEQFDDKIFQEIESLTYQTEDLLRPHFSTLRISVLPPIPSLQPARRGSVPVEGNQNNQNNIDNAIDSLGHGDSNLRRFHLSCQTSYLSISCDLHIAFINSRISSQKSVLSPPFSPTASPLTATSTDEDFLTSELSKSTPGPTPFTGSTPHSGAISELCKAIRIEIEGIGLLAPGGILKIKSKTLISPANNMEPISLSVNDVIKTSLLKCSEQLVGIVFPYTVSDDITVSPAQLRACQSNISDIRSLLVSNQGPESLGSGLDQVAVISLVASVERDMLWQLILKNNDADDQKDDDNNNNINDMNNKNVKNVKNNKSKKWEDLAFWNQRSRVHKNQLVAWEKSQSEVGAIKTTLIETERELKSRIEELRASKTAYKELNSMMLDVSSSSSSSAILRVSTGSSGNNEQSLELSSSSTDTKNNLKLKAEIEVLTSALKVLEIQFEGAERENKRIRSAGRVPDTTVGNTSRAAVTMAEMVRVWRGIAAHRLMLSMPPLPTNIDNTDAIKKNRYSSFTPAPLDNMMTSPRIEEHNPSSNSSDPNNVPVNVTALRTYRELRELRSRVRVLGRGSPGEKANLIEKYTQSIFLCGGTLIK